MKNLKVILFALLIMAIEVLFYNHYFKETSKPLDPPQKKEQTQHAVSEIEQHISTLNEPDSYKSIEAVNKLGEMGEKATPAVSALISKLGDDDSDVRSASADALAKIGVPAVEPLIEALKSEKWEVRWNAEWALKKITDKDFGQDHERWLNYSRGLSASGGKK